MLALAGPDALVTGAVFSFGTYFCMSRGFASAFFSLLRGRNIWFRLEVAHFELVLGARMH